MRLGFQDWTNVALARLNPRDPMGRFYRFERQKEGFMMPEQAKVLRDLLNTHIEVKKILEIGFNGGHSAYNFLAARKNTHVTSVEIDYSSKVAAAKKRIDALFPGRHTLMYGDSKEVLPGLAAVSAQFDLIFVDGDHNLAGVTADLNNGRFLAHEDTILVMDDYNASMPWGVGPVKAWDDARESDVIIQTQEHNTNDRRSFVIGHYAIS